MRNGLLLAVLLLAAGCESEKSEPPMITSLVGTWRSDVQFESGAFASVKDLQFIYGFHIDGTLMESSNYDGAPPVPPAYGVWRRTGPGEYEAKYEFFATAPADPESFAKGGGWLPAGHGVLTEKIKLAPDGKGFTSTIEYQAFDQAGKPTEGGGKATGRGTRISF